MDGIKICTRICKITSKTTITFVLSGGYMQHITKNNHNKETGTSTRYMDSISHCRMHCYISSTEGRNGMGGNEWDSYSHCTNITHLVVSENIMEVGQ